MNKLLFAAPASGSGKTTVTCAVLTALKRRGLRVHAFKCGPDYIDPMFHRAALGIPCHNLDLYLTPEDRLKQLFVRYSAGADVAVAEGVMGFYDGVGGVTPQASALYVADVLDLPVVLVARPKGASLSLSALVNGLQTVPESATSICGAEAATLDSHIRGLILSDCSEMLYRSLKPMLEQETGLPVLGFLPHLEDAQFESRHLGLVSAEEDPELQHKLDLLAEAAEAHIDLDALLALGDVPEEPSNAVAPAGAAAAPASLSFPAPDLRIAVASDEAFRFCYDETLDAFRDAGMEPVFFSPMRDDRLPEHIDALYLPGGYPEKHLEALTRNEAARKAIKTFADNGGRIIAECGGMMYLCKEIITDEGSYTMCDVLPYSISARQDDRKLSLGYRQFTLNGQQFRGHEFHYTQFVGDVPPSITQVYNANGEPVPTPVFRYKNVLASYTHLYQIPSDL